MNHLPAISILIPVYNVEQYIKRCIMSVIAQTYTGKMECILVDDCGTDNSIIVAEQLIAGYKGNIKFSIIPHEHNRGLAAARNTAVDAAHGDFVMHVDSDDWIEPNMIEQLVLTQQETGADIVSCNAVAHFETKDILLEEPCYSSKDEMMRSIIQMTLDHVIWRRLIRTSLYKDNRIKAYEGINMGEDYYTLPRLLFYADTFARCNDVLYHYNCLNVQSYMQSHRKEIFSFPKYKSDRDSIDVLISFFAQHDTTLLEELYKIKATFIYKQFSPAIQMRNREAYLQICSDWRGIDKQYKQLSALRNYMLTLSYNISVMYVSVRMCVMKLLKRRTCR